MSKAQDLLIQKQLHSGLIDTDSSINQKTTKNIEESHQNVEISRNKNKKRIGQYYYYLNKIIGSGYSSIVYEGHKNCQGKSTKYAIKAIRLEAISKANYKLLQNQIKIIRQLNHPNVLQCVDVLYTKHHYYIITEYCESGTLQQHIESNFQVNWNKILYQIVQGCKYLNHSLIVHRDIKPANIFCKQGVWKIGDFGFARHIQNANLQIKQKFTIGSPLYMSPEALIQNIYSLKTDSFALGVLMYYTITKQFPWRGLNKQELIENYRSKPFLENNAKFKELNRSMKQIIKGLCQKDISKRLSISQCDFEILQIEKSKQQIKQSLLILKKNITEQVTFAQYIYYLYKNMEEFLPKNQILFQLVAFHLHHITVFCDWESNKSLKQIQEKYNLPKQITSKTFIFDKSDYKCLQKKLLETSKALLESGILLNIVGAQKLLQYRWLIKIILRADSQNLLVALKGLQIQTNFKGIMPNDDQIDDLLAIQ